jgi:hypothetical protein
MAEIELATLFGSNFASTHFISEIGTSTDTGLVMRNSLKPSYRPLKKRLRGHENAPISSLIYGLDNSVGKSHIVENW